MGDGLFGASDSLFGIPAIGAPKVGFHQLVVLGNGFDLECGLPTRFSHFFEPRLEALLTQNWKSTGRLEENFSGYMVSVCSDNSDYIERSFRLLGWMLATRSSCSTTSRTPRRARISR